MCLRSLSSRCQRCQTLKDWVFQEAASTKKLWWRSPKSLGQWELLNLWQELRNSHRSLNMLHSLRYLNIQSQELSWKRQVLIWTKLRRRVLVSLKTSACFKDSESRKMYMMHLSKEDLLITHLSRHHLKWKKSLKSKIWLSQSQFKRCQSQRLKWWIIKMLEIRKRSKTEKLKKIRLSKSDIWMDWKLWFSIKVIQIWREMWVVS